MVYHVPPTNGSQVPPTNGDQVPPTNGPQVSPTNGPRHKSHQGAWSHLLMVGIGKFRYIDIEKKFENIDYIENMQIRTELRKCRFVNIPHHKQQNKYIPRATTAKKTKLGETNRISKVYLLQYDHFMS